MRTVKLIFFMIAAIMFLASVGISNVGTSSKITKKKPQKSAMLGLPELLPLDWESPVSSPFVDVSASTSTTSTSTIPPTTTTHTHPLRKITRTVRSIPNDIWGSLANCESGMNQRATSSSGKYLGYFQFSMSTWRSVGGSGDPRDHDYEGQLKYAQILQARSGWSQWPACSSKLGLR